MSPEPKGSVQELLMRRQLASFVGRSTYIQKFEGNLALNADDPQRRFIVNIYGQGGAGKTWLLRRLNQLAQERNAATAMLGDDATDELQMLEGLAGQMRQQCYPNNEFDKLYKLYLQRKGELEAMEGAPKGTAAFIGSSAVKVGLGLAKATPIGVVTGLIDADALASQFGEWTSFVARKLGQNKDEVRLVLEPVETLTPLVLAQLNEIASQRPLVIFFDTFERTAHYLDAWLHACFEGKFGPLSPSILWTVAGRNALEPASWQDLSDVILRLELLPFEEAEAKKYLEGKGITQPQEVEAILRLTNRLPLLVATLAEQGPSQAGGPGDPSATAVERFLKWVDEPFKRKVALEAALPRLINRDVVAQLAGEERADELYEWMKDMPFIAERDRRRVYNSVVRDPMLRTYRQDAPQGWAELHLKLAAYYDKRRADLGLEDEACSKDADCQALQLETLYHRLCRAPQQGLPAALNGFMDALKLQSAFASRWADTIHQAGVDAGYPAAAEWGERLRSGMQAYGAQNYPVAIEMFTSLLKNGWLEDDQRAIALDYRGYLYTQAEKYDLALKDLDEAIDLAPDLPEIWVDRHQVHRKLERYEDAWEDISEAIRLNPSAGWQYLLRGVLASHSLGKFEAAIEDLTAAVEKLPDLGVAVGLRGVVYSFMERYDEALQDLGKAIEMKTEPLGEFYAIRANIYRSQKRFAEALAETDLAIAADPDNPLWVSARIPIYQQLGDLKGLAEAYRQISERAVVFVRNLRENVTLVSPLVVEQNLQRLVSSLGQPPEMAKLMVEGVYSLAQGDEDSAIRRVQAEAAAFQAAANLQSQEYDQALAALNLATELDPQRWNYWSARGQVYAAQKIMDKAIADFDHAIELAPQEPSVYALRAQSRLAGGDPAAALADISRAIDMSHPPASGLYAIRAEIHRQMGGLRQAVNDIEQALQISPDIMPWLALRIALLKSLGDVDGMVRAYTDLSGKIDLYIEQMGAIYKAQTPEQLKAGVEIDLAAMGLQGKAAEGARLEKQAIINAMRDDPAEARRILQGEVLETVGYGHLRANRIDEAVQTFSQALELDNQRANRWYLRALAYSVSNRPKETLADLDKAIALRPDFAEAIDLRGETHWELRDYEGAAQDYSRVIELGAGQEDTYRGLGRALRRLGRYDGALENFNTAIQKFGDSPRAYADRGETYRMIDRHPEALADFNHALQMKPDFDEALAGRGYVYKALQQPDQAIQDFDAALKLDPDYAWVLLQRGLYYHETGQYALALADYDRLQQVDPQERRVFELRSWLLYALRQDERALTNLDQAIEDKPGNLDLLAMRAEVLMALGKFDLALADYQFVLDQEPENIDRHTALSELYLRMQRPQDAMLGIERALREFPDNDWYIYLRALASVEQGKAAEAQDGFGRALQIAQNSADPQNPTAIFNLGLYQLALGEDAAAAGEYERGLALKPTPEILRPAVRDLRGYLAVRPKNAQAKKMLAQLEKYPLE